jgi:hypothetical protein
MVGTTTTTALYALNFQHQVAPVSTTTIGSYYGNLFLPTLSNTATYTNMYGTFARIDMAAAATTGSVAAWYGFFSADPVRNAAANVSFTNHIGFYAQNPSSITATNVYGVQSVISSGTNRYNIYASGTADNYFNGNVGIGGLPTVKLDVSGATKISGITTITNNTTATSTGTGALVVSGGAGIGGNLYIGGTIYGTIVGNVSTATNLSNGTAGQVPYQTAPGVTSFYGPGTAGQLLVSSGTNAPVYTNTSSIYVGRSDVANTATTATNLFFGTAGQIPYQTAPNVTSFFGPGTAGNVLVSNGTSAPSYNNTLTLVGTTTSISTTTGALQVRGGVGVGGSVYVGNRVGFVGTNSASVVYQVYNAATNSLDTVFG